MKKHLSILAVISLVALLLGSCGAGEPVENSSNSDAASESQSAVTSDASVSAQETEPAESNMPYTFTDSMGHTVTLEEKPETVAVLFSSFADLWQLAGGEVDITVGESVERGFVGDDVLLVDDGAGKTIDNELLLSYEPDLVIGSSDIEAQAETVGLCADAGIPAAGFRVESFEDYLSVLSILTEITGDHDAYQQNGEEVGARIEQMLSDLDFSEKGYDILFIRAGSQYSSTKAKGTEDNFVCGMLAELGLHNIADDAPVLLDGLSLEEIITADPDYIFISTMGNEDAAKEYMESVFAEDGYRQLTAVAEGNYAFLPKDLFQFKPNARWDEAYQYLIDLVETIPDENEG